MKNRGDHRILYVLFEGLWLYTLLTWVYIAIENLIYPAAVFNSVLSVYVPIKQNLLAIVSFILSFVFFILWRYYRTLPKRPYD
ncbi:MAG: hypothetical protein OH316_00735 [Candidatus Parvarchaeota archaeon]|nr:hypothetical protein [Candidatus Parvarchaeota archaeon]MCW1301648.1 hypothetical protein [Candidatus Parvarchaeota archaeon]